MPDPQAPLPGQLVIVGEVPTTPDGPPVLVVVQGDDERPGGFQVQKMLRGYVRDRWPCASWPDALTLARTLLPRRSP
jgi:hypothetical protein